MTSSIRVRAAGCLALAGLAIVVLASCVSPAREMRSSDAASILPPYPAEERYVKCLREKGWDEQRSLLSPPVTENVPPQQESVYAADRAACGSSSGYTRTQTPSMWTEAQKKQLYAEEVANHDCIVGKGLPSGQPPSEATFLDTFGSSKGWYQAIAAYLESGSLDQAEYSSLLRECPPPLMFLSIEGF